MRRKKYFKYKKERVLLSDVLPYEVPLTFSNKPFYNTILKNKVFVEHVADKDFLYWLKTDTAFDVVMCLIAGSKYIGSDVKTEARKGLDYNYIEANSRTIPFSYKITHKEKEYRELSICHPLNQLLVVDFYNIYKNSILYYCNRSDFSLRKASKVAKYTFRKDKLHYDLLSEDISSKIEEYDKEYENLKTFFVYEDYSNIYKFYESYTYLRCEKKFSKLIKLDISKCFGSIYTHSISWAVLGKEATKANLNKSKKTFSGCFDKLMQSLNFVETNGIIIGPEFSRVFAEIILQSIDVNLLKAVNSKYKHKVDYRVFRYVDDYFVFCNDDGLADEIISHLHILLGKYKLSLNMEKKEIIERPIITPLSIAKQKIANLLEDRVNYKINTIKKEDGIQIEKGGIFIDSKAMTIQFKTILKETLVDYKSVLPYTLSIIENKIEKIIKAYKEPDVEHVSENSIIQAMINLLDFVFLIYSASPRVNNTIKLCQILKIIIVFSKNYKNKKKSLSYDHKHQIYKKIYDSVSLIIKMNKQHKYTKVETLYLLIIIAELGKEYWLEENSLIDFFNIKLEEGAYSCNEDIDYFSITVLIFYIKNKKRYNGLRGFIESYLISKFRERKNSLLGDTELTILVLDIISCPYVSRVCKQEILSVYDIDAGLHNDLISKGEFWFTKWSEFNFEKELDSKRSLEVY